MGQRRTWVVEGNQKPLLIGLWKGEWGRTCSSSPFYCLPLLKAVSNIASSSFNFIRLYTPFMFSFLGKGQAADLCVLESMRYWTTGSPCTMTTLHVYCVLCTLLWRCVYQTFPYSSLKTNIDSSEKKWANIRTFSPFGLFNEITFSKL